MPASSRTQSMLDTALEFEARGQAFYANAVAVCKNPFGAAMFRKLLEDERDHVGRIERISRAVKAGADWSGELRDGNGPVNGVSSFFTALANKTKASIAATTTDFEALDVGIELERAAVRFYETELAALVDGTEQRFVREMIAEERDHLSSLIELRKFLEDPEGWYKANEKVVVDG